MTAITERPLPGTAARSSLPRLGRQGKMAKPRHTIAVIHLLDAFETTSPAGPRVMLPRSSCSTMRAATHRGGATPT